MATLTKDQIEHKMQLIKEKTEEINLLKNELIEAGAWPLDDDELDKAAGGGGLNQVYVPDPLQPQAVIK